MRANGASTTLTGGLLVPGAGAYVAGNLAGRNVVDGESRKLLVALSGALVLATALFGGCRLSLPASAAIFAAAAFAAGIRTLVSSASGLAAAPETRASVLGIRAATMQIGYVAGSALAGIALATGGYAALGVAIGVSFALGAHVLLPWRPSLVVPVPGGLQRPAPSRSIV